MDFYGSTGNMKSALQVFNSIKVQNRRICTYNVMMNALIVNGKDMDALLLFDSLCDIPIKRDMTTYLYALKACSNMMDVERGNRIIQEIEALKAPSIELKTAIFHYHGSCGDIDSAEKVFDTLSVEEWNVVNITAMMSIYVRCNREADALLLYDKVQNMNISNDNDISQHILALRAYGRRLDLDGGVRIHRRYIDHLRGSVPFKNALIDFYGTVHRMDLALEIFECRSNIGNDVVTIGTMMKCYIENGHFEDALKVYDECDTPMNAVCHLLAIKACSGIYDFEKGQDIISQHIQLDQASSAMKNVVLDFHVRRNNINSAMQIFHSLSAEEKSVVRTNKMMQTLIQYGDSEGALKLYDSMLDKNEKSHILGLKACGRLGQLQRGQTIHNRIREEMSGFGESIHVKATLIDFYGNCLDIESAENIFDSITENQHNIVTVSSMMSAYLHSSRYHEVVAVYKEHCADIEPDRGSQLILLKACGLIGDCVHCGFGKEIIQNLAGDERQSDIVIKTAMIDFHGNCHDVQSAENVFLTIDDEEHNIMSFGAMMNAYFVNQRYFECIDLFRGMGTLKGDPISPDIKAWRLVLAACSKTDQNFEVRQGLHEQMKRDQNGWKLGKDPQIQCSLITFYAQNGMIEQCREVFDQHIEQQGASLTVWHSMLQALGRNGLLDDAKALFYELRERGKKHCSDLTLDQYSYSIMLSACSHCGDMQSAVEIWNSIPQDEWPTIKYDRILITNLVDGFSRRGHLNAAWEYIVEYEMFRGKKPYAPMWRALLSAAVRYRAMAMARFVYDEYKARLKSAPEELPDADIQNIMGTANGILDEQHISKEMTQKTWEDKDDKMMEDSDIKQHEYSQRPDFLHYEPDLFEEQYSFDDLDTVEAHSED